MADDTDKNLMLSILKDLQSGQSRVEQGQRLTNERLGAIEHHMAGFHVSLSTYHEEIDTIKDRIARIEKRLELVDDSTPET